jgi:hypothetical protein
VNNAVHSRFKLFADQRERITDILDSEDEELFLQIEEILTDYNRRTLPSRPSRQNQR